MTGTAAVVPDDTALLALGAGSRLLSRLITAAPGRVRPRIYAPAMCVTAAVAARPSMADHVGGLEAIEVVDLGFADAARAGAMIARGTDWRRAHAVVTARPALEWPTSLPLITAEADAYASFGLQLIDLSSS